MTVSRPKADAPVSNAPAAAPPDAAQETFVINLVSSTTPMALTQPKLAELKDYTFFVSRRLEDGRERFRLHMGYFDSLLQAEDLLPLVREVYPGAWAGEAPGKRLRARAAAAAAPAAAPAPKAAPPQPATPARAVAPPSAQVPPAPPVKVPAPPAPPVISAAPAMSPAAAAAPVRVAVAAPAEAPAARRAPPAAPSAEILAKTPTLSAAPEEDGSTREVPAFTLELMPDPAPPAATAPPQISAAPAPAPPVLKPSATPDVVPERSESSRHAPVQRANATRRDAKLPFDQRSNVREVMKSLDESGLKLPKTRLPSEPAVREPGVLPESRVMRLLEEKRGGDPLSTTSTPAAFAVQLQWSVQQIDLARVPPLAIFGAYTLYTVEGSREGRRWFGLRLGFFKDAHSAKQVAQYVRSEFASVAVVPVSLKERDGASGPGNNQAPQAASKVTNQLPEVTGEFKLIEDTNAPPTLVPVDAAEAAASSADAAAATADATASGGATSGGSTAHKTPKARGNRVHARAKRAPKTLEETLEILGADQLQIEGARKKRPSVADAPPQAKARNSALSRLLDKLSERGR